jgi:hypothetical protein
MNHVQEDALREALMTHIPRITNNKIEAIIRRMDTLIARERPAGLPVVNGEPAASSALCDCCGADDAAACNAQGCGYLDQGDVPDTVVERAQTVLAEVSGVRHARIYIHAMLVAIWPGRWLSYQARVGQWTHTCFGEEDATNPVMRIHRFIEEALELGQALHCSRTEVLQLVEYVYGRPIGDPSQEVGGVMVTLAALCHAKLMDMLDAGERELTRVWANMDRIRAKHASAPRFSPLPGPT